MSKNYTIVSQLDNTRIHIDSQTAKGSLLLQNLIEEYDEDVLVIPDIKGEILNLIFEFLIYTKNNPCSVIPKPLHHFNFREFLSEWECRYMERFDNDIYKLFDLINAANYLDVRGLFEIACAKAAYLVKDFDQDEFKEVFQIEPDMNQDDNDSLVKQFELSKENRYR